MGDTIRCEDCGAAARASVDGTHPDRFCRFCGAAFRVQEPPAPVVVQETRAAERDRRFAELKAHKGTRRARRSAPSAAPAIAKHSGIMLLLFAALAIAVVIGAFQCSIADEAQRGFDGGMPRGMHRDIHRGFPGGGPRGFSPPSTFLSLFKILPVAMVGFIVFRIFRSGSKAARVATSPTESWPACVIEETTEQRGHGDSRRSVTVLTLEDDSGQRQSYDVGSRLARQVARDDMGIAHTRGDELIGFTRIDV